MRVLLGGVAAALALTAVPQPAAAQSRTRCVPEFAVVCFVINTVHNTCVHPKVTSCE